MDYKLGEVESGDNFGLHGRPHWTQESHKTWYEARNAFMDFVWTNCRHDQGAYGSRATCQNCAIDFIAIAMALALQGI